jgi:GxxExxY protein
VDENECSKRIIGAAIEVHGVLGTGLLESAYERALAVELVQRGVRIERHVLLPARYKGVDLGDAYRIDLLVEGLVIIEVKALVCFAPIHTAQILTYLRMAGKKLGLLLNFHAPSMRAGVRRVANNF